MQKLLVVSLCSLVILLTSCTEVRETPQDSVELDTLVEDYFEAYLKLNPLTATFIGDMRYNDRLANNLSPQYRADSERLNRVYLERLKAVHATKLDRQDRLTYETFKLDREQELEMLEFPGHLLAINQFYSFANSFAQLGSGTSAHPFSSQKDYEDFLSRMDDFLLLVDQAIANMREGVDQDVTQPRVLMERTLPQLAVQITDFAASPDYGPIEHLPDELPDEVKDLLAERYEQALAYKVGELKIHGLRTWAEAELGEKFDVREFHAQVLMDGALPLSLLESKINQWMKSKQA